MSSHPPARVFEPLRRDPANLDGAGEPVEGKRDEARKLAGRLALIIDFQSPAAFFSEVSSGPDGGLGALREHLAALRVSKRPLGPLLEAPGTENKRPRPPFARPEPGGKRV